MTLFMRFVQKCPVLCGIPNSSVTLLNKHCIAAYLAGIFRHTNELLRLLQWRNIYTFITRAGISSLLRMCLCTEEHLDVIMAKTDSMDRSNLADRTPVFASTFSLQLRDPITIPPWLHNRPACICDFICSSCQYFCSQSLLLFTLLAMCRHVFICRGV